MVVVCFPGGLVDGGISHLYFSHRSLVLDGEVWLSLLLASGGLRCCMAQGISTELAVVRAEGGGI